MSVLVFVDQDGDPVAVDAAAIVGLSVGRVTGPRDARQQDEATVTLIWAGVAQPFMVVAPFAEVLEQWTAARQPGGASLKAHPETTGWLYHPVVKGERQ